MENMSKSTIILKNPVSAQVSPPPIQPQASGPDRFINDFFQTFKGQISKPSFIKLFQTQEQNEHVINSFYEQNDKFYAKTR